MKLLDILNRFYYSMALNELRLMNQNTVYPSITYNSLLYLDLISYKEECTVSYLSKILHISKAAVTIKVNELERQGLVTKTRSEKDRRVFYISISPQVKAEYTQYDHCMKKATAMLEATFTADELCKFERMLDIVKDAYLKDS